MTSSFVLEDDTSRFPDMTRLLVTTGVAFFCSFVTGKNDVKTRARQQRRRVLRQLVARLGHTISE